MHFIGCHSRLPGQRNGSGRVRCRSQAVRYRRDSRITCNRTWGPALIPREPECPPPGKLTSFVCFAQKAPSIGCARIGHRGWRVYAPSRRANRPAVLRLVHHGDGFLQAASAAFLIRRRPLKRPIDQSLRHLTSRKTAGPTALRACLVNEAITAVVPMFHNATFIRLILDGRLFVQSLVRWSSFDRNLLHFDL